MRQAPLPYSAPVPDWTPPAPPDLSRFAVVEVDCETTGVSWVKGDRPVGIAVGTPAGRYYLPFRHAGGGNLDEEIVRRWAQRELRGKRIRNHSTRFDIHMLREWGVDLTEQDCTFHDVQHSAALLDDQRRRFSLEELAQAELGVGKIDVGPKDFIADQPASVIAPYAERDVELVSRLADVYAPRLRAERLERVSALEDNIIPVVVEIERNGMPLDLDLLERLHNESGRVQEHIQWELYRRAGFIPNPDSPVDLTRLFQTYHEQLYVVCRKKQCRKARAHPSPKKCICGQDLPTAPSFPDKIIRPAAKRHEVIQLAWRLGKLRDMRSKFYTKYRAEHVNGVLYPKFNQLKSDDGGTVTGRFSGDMQQVMGADKYQRSYGWIEEYSPEDFRIKRLFIPAVGPWCNADMRQVEYRIFVHYARSDRLLAYYRNDPYTDFHEIVGSFVRPYRRDVTRTEIKTVNFLSLYGGGVGPLSSNLDITVEEAHILSDAYHQAFPEVRQLQRQAEDVAKARGYVKSFLGRRCRFPTDDRTYKALNSVIQPTAADANKLALVDIYRERKHLGLTLRMTTHDSVECDLTDPSLQKDYEDLLNQQRLPLSVPLYWDVKTGDRWANCK